MFKITIHEINLRYILPNPLVTTPPILSSSFDEYPVVSVRGSEPHTVIAFDKIFDSPFAIDFRDHDIAGFRRATPVDNDEVALHNPGVNHESPEIVRR